MRAVLALLLLVSGCVAQVCPENLNLTADTEIPYPQFPDLGAMQKVFDRTVSVSGEAYVLAVYADGAEYYVRHHPARTGTQRLYGPFSGDPLEELRCA